MMRVLIWSLALLWATSLSVSVARADTANPEVTKAEALIDAGKNQQALATINAYLAKHPSDPCARRSRGCL